MYAFAKANAVEPIEDGYIRIPAFGFHPNVSKKSLLKFVEEWLLIRVFGSATNSWKDMHVAYKKRERESLMALFREETEGAIKSATDLTEWPEQLGKDLQRMRDQILKIDQEFPKRDPNVEDSIVDDVWTDLLEESGTHNMDSPEARSVFKTWIRTTLETVQERKTMMLKHQKLLCELTLEKKEQEMLRDETEVDLRTQMIRLRMEKMELRRQIAESKANTTKELDERNYAYEYINGKPTGRRKVYQNGKTSDWEEGVYPRHTAERASDTRSGAQGEETEFLPRESSGFTKKEERIYNRLKKDMITRGIHPNLPADSPRERLRRKPEGEYPATKDPVERTKVRKEKPSRLTPCGNGYAMWSNKSGSVEIMLPCDFHKRRGVSAEDCLKSDKHCFECSTAKKLAEPVLVCGGPHQYKNPNQKEKKVATKKYHPQQ